MPLATMFLGDLAEGWRLTAMAAQWFHARRHPRLRLDDQCQHDVIEVGSMLPTVAARVVHDLFVEGVVAVTTVIDMEAGPLERHNLPGKAQTLGCRGRNQTVECGDAIRNVDTLTAMASSGHKSLAVFRRYNTIAPQDLRKAIQQLGTYMDTTSSHGHTSAR